MRVKLGSEMMLTRVVYWGAWPRANEQKISPEEDRIYMNVLGSKPYMMGVSPHFYTSKSPPTHPLHSS